VNKLLAQQSSGRTVIRRRRTTLEQRVTLHGYDIGIRKVSRN